MADEVTHDKHIGNALDGLSSIEMAGWMEYFKLKDEIQTNRLIVAIRRAFNGDKADKPQKRRQVDDDDEEVIDTTKPEFAEKFRGFINTKAAPQQSRSARQQSTQIIMG